MNKLWFKAKRYGWGWCPCSAEGWVVLTAFIAAIIVTMKYVPEHQKQVILLVTYAIILITICYKKGETPSWRWG